MNGLKRILLGLTTAAILAFHGSSLADIKFQTQSPEGLDLQNLPPPITDFVNGFSEISNVINGKVGQYIKVSPIQGPINFNQINQLNLTQWLQNLSQIPVIGDIYPIIVKILQLVGNLIIWILGVAMDLIRQGLSLLR